MRILKKILYYIFFLLFTLQKLSSKENNNNFLHTSHLSKTINLVSFSANIIFYARNFYYSRIFVA